MHDEIMKILTGRSLSAKDIRAELAALGLRVSLADVVRELASLEKEGMIRRVEGVDYNPFRPLTSSLWSASEVRHGQSKVEVIPPASGETMIIASLPLQNMARTIGGVVAMLDAIDSIISSAEEGMYLSAPFIDASVTPILARHYSEISRLSFIRIMVDISMRDIAVLERLKSIIDNLEYRTFGNYKLVHGKAIKASGLHLKAIAVDEKLALIGTFNFKETHIAADYDLGVMLRGEAASKVWKILDTIWNSYERT